MNKSNTWDPNRPNNMEHDLEIEPEGLISTISRAEGLDAGELNAFSFFALIEDLKKRNNG